MADLGQGVQPEPRRPAQYIPVRPRGSGRRTAVIVSLIVVVGLGLCGAGVWLWA
jgi:hypothetical protein